MGLDFTSIKDREGAAVYLMHNGGFEQQKQMQALAEQLQAVSKAQIAVVDGSTEDGRQIQQFYGLDTDNYPHVLVVRDDDELAGQWAGSEQPTVDQIAYTVNSANGGTP